jgi:GTPase SAR1 family protein
VRNINSKLASADPTIIQELPSEPLSSLFKNFAQRLVGKVRLNDESIKEKRLPNLSLSESISPLDLSELQSQSICIIGRSTLGKTSLCKLLIDEALSNQRTVYVISGGNQEYDTYQDQINLKWYRPPMIISEEYDFYLDNTVYKLLQDIEPVEHALILIDEIDLWTKRLDIIENLFTKAQAAKAQVICVSQNYRLEEEFLKRFPVLLIPKTTSMKRERWEWDSRGHDFFLRMDRISILEKEAQPFSSPFPIFQIRHLKPEQA